MPTSAVISDLGRFAIIPEWLLDSDVSPQAIRLFAVLAAKYADRTTDVGIVPRKRLADALHVQSPRTVDAGVGDLVRVGALTVQRRAANRESEPSRYVLHFVARGSAEDRTTPSAEDRTPVPDVPRSRGIASPLVPPKGGATRSIDRKRGLRSIRDVLREAAGA